jgi:hypothetical protein
MGVHPHDLGTILDEEKVSPSVPGTTAPSR